jgi:CRISP-associated protein Cas1
MIRKTVEFSTRGTRLSVAYRQLVIERPDMPKATLPIEDLGVVIVDDSRASYTQAVFIELLEAGATLMVTGKDHLPIGMMLPLDAHHVSTERHRAQIEASEPVRKRAWQALISAKIRQQAHILEHFTNDHAGLMPMAKRVKSGDPDNLEAQAAQKYWPRLFGKEFRRDRGAEGINAALNYGYAVVRASAARAIVASGLIPSLGVFHKNRSNPFCLADDLFEPYRPYVDWRVKKMVLEAKDKPLDLNDRPTRAALLTVFNETISIDGRRWPLLIGLQQSASSLARVLTTVDKSKNCALALPDGLPLQPDLLDGADDYS